MPSATALFFPGRNFRGGGNVAARRGITGSSLA
jgi:hypothetical protein